MYMQVNVCVFIAKNLEEIRLKMWYPRVISLSAWQGVGGGLSALNFLQICFTWVRITPNMTTEDSFKHPCVNYRCFQVYFGSFNH